jgi:CMP-N-acetylneuraminic acid synthetase
MNPQIVSLIIGRGGSTLTDKNILPVFGRPLLHYTAAAARRSEFIGRFFISSDCRRILEAGRQAGYEKIVRPEFLSLPTSQSVDVVKHAVDIISHDSPVEILVVQHANVGTISTTIIDDCIRLLVADENLSSVVPVHEKSEYHPYRAKTLDSDGLLKPFFDFGNMPVSGNRQDLPVSYFFDHSIWVLRVAKSVHSENGQPPWTCMGNQIKPYITEGCFDVHSIEDLKATEEWILGNQIELPNFEEASCEPSHDEC